MLNRFASIPCPMTLELREKKKKTACVNQNAHFGPSSQPKTDSDQTRVHFLLKICIFLEAHQ